jgi:hypothetical protein
MDRRALCALVSPPRDDRRKLFGSPSFRVSQQFLLQLVYARKSIMQAEDQNFERLRINQTVIYAMESWMARA